MSSVHPQSTNGPEDADDISSPMVKLMYDFCTKPESSKVAYSWACLTAWIAVMRILAIALESCDGPNWYHDREINQARYRFLLTYQQYWELYITCMVPLVLDAIGRVITLCFLIFAKENREIYLKLVNDNFEIILFVFDTVSVIPFLVAAVYTRQNNVTLNQAELVVTTLLELLIAGRILRFIKDMPAVKAIRIALYHSADHLVLPIFFFFVFNITAGVFFYFAEPCYNTDSCPWKDLFTATFFSIVTMTTSKCICL